MKLDKPTPTLNKTLTKKLFEDKSKDLSKKNIIVDEKELPSLKSDKKIEIDSILGKSYSDF